MKKNKLKTKAILNDGVVSLFTALGQKYEAVKYTGKKITDNQLSKAYMDSWLTAKYINKQTEDMLKVPRVFSGDFDENLLKLVTAKEKRLNIGAIKESFLSWGSLYGDCLVIAFTNEDDMTEPCADDEDIKRFLVLTKGEYTPDTQLDDNLLSANFGKPTYYIVKDKKIHHSRCHRLKLGNQKLTDKAQYGVSDLQDKMNAIKLFDTTVTCIGDLIQDSNVDVLFIPGMMDKISAGQENEIQKFLEVVKMTKSSMNMIALDAGDSQAQGRWEQKTATYSGLSDVFGRLITLTAGALDMPVTVLFGLSASGFSTGEEDLESYHGKINARQESRLRPLQDFIDRFILNKIIQDNNLIYEYPSIKMVSEEKEATVFGQYATGFVSLVTAGVITDKVAQSEMMARGLFKNTAEDDLKDGDLFTTSEYS